MTELEQRLTTEFGKLAEQYEQEQKRLAGQVEHLEERAAIGRSARVRSEGVYQVEQDLRGAGDTLGGASAAIGRSARVRSEGVYRVEREHGRAAGNLERTCREIDQGIQRTSAAFGRGLKSMRIEMKRSLPERGRGDGAVEVVDGTSAVAAESREEESHRRFNHPDGRRASVSCHKESATLPLKTLRSVIEIQARWEEDDLRRLKLIK